MARILSMIGHRTKLMVFIHEGWFPCFVLLFYSHYWRCINTALLGCSATIDCRRILHTCTHCSMPLIVCVCRAGIGGAQPRTGWAYARPSLLLATPLSLVDICIYIPKIYTLITTNIILQPCTHITLLVTWWLWAANRIIVCMQLHKCCIYNYC